MKNYNWRNKQTSESLMEELTFKFYDITNNILNDYIIEGFKQTISNIKADYTTESGYNKVYTEEQIEKVKAVNKICRQIAKLEF